VEHGAIRFGLGAVKNVGQGAIEAILAARRGRPEAGIESGPFSHLYDFCQRTDQRALNKRVLESLAAAGAFDSLPGHRAQQMAAIPLALEAGQLRQSERERGQFNLFGGGGAEAAAPIPEPKLPGAPEWDGATKLREEKAVLGFHLSDHPLASLREEIAAVASVDSQGLAERGDNQDVVFVGVVSAIKRTPTRNGGLMAWVTLEDFAGSVECICFSDLYEKCKDTLAPDRIVLVRGRSNARDEDDVVKIVAQEISDFETMKTVVKHTLHVALNTGELNDNLLLRIRDAMSRYPGLGEVVLHVDAEGGRVKIRAGRLKVAVSGGLLAELRTLLGPEKVRLAEAKPLPQPVNGRARPWKEVHEPRMA
jgi:DNA polymerase-3 subunit alpha